MQRIRKKQQEMEEELKRKQTILEELTRKLQKLEEEFTKKQHKLEEELTKKQQKMEELTTKQQKMEDELKKQQQYTEEELKKYQQLMKELLENMNERVMPKVEELLARHSPPTTAASLVKRDVMSSTFTPSTSIPSATPITPGISDPSISIHSLLASITISLPGQSIHEVAEVGDVKALRKMLSEGEKVDARDPSGNTALHVAAERGHVAAVETLVEGGANVAARGSLMRHPLHLAAAEGHVHVVRCLVKLGAALDQPDAKGDTPLALAAARGQTIVLETLLQLGAAINPRNREHTPLLMAVEAGQIESVKLLLDKGAGVEADNKLSLLTAASKKGFADILRILLKVSLVKPTEFERCLLDAKNSDVVWAILEDERFSMYETLGSRAISEAARNGRTSVLEALLQAGCRCPETLRNLVNRGDANLLSVFISQGCDVNERNSGQTLLHFAAWNARANCVQVLLDAGADVSLSDSGGITPLHYAAMTGATQCARLLVDAGADVNASRDKDTPFKLAYNRRHFDTAKFLHERGGR